MKAPALSNRVHACFAEPFCHLLSRIQGRKDIIMIARAGIIAAFVLSLGPQPVRAAEATVVLDVHHAYCALCPTIVKKTLEHVKGVTNVTVGQADAKGDMSGTVKYDDAQGSAAAMIKAATDQGYPSEVSSRTKG
jgi:mercuric ion binding protein